MFESLSASDGRAMVSDWMLGFGRRLRCGADGRAVGGQGSENAIGRWAGGWVRCGACAREASSAVGAAAPRVGALMASEDSPKAQR